MWRGLAKGVVLVVLREARTAAPDDAHKSNAQGAYILQRVALLLAAATSGVRWSGVLFGVAAGGNEASLLFPCTCWTAAPPAEAPHGCFVICVAQCL